jgi:hypothetical protein
LCLAALALALRPTGASGARPRHRRAARLDRAAELAALQAKSQAVSSADPADPAHPACISFCRLGRPFVINMEYRADCMTAFSDRMDAIGIANVTVVRGVPHECGRPGLTLAYITALQLCWASPWEETCLIMEDDFGARMPAAQAGGLLDLFYGDVKAWDVLMLSCNLQKYMRHEGHGAWCPP